MYTIGQGRLNTPILRLHSGSKSTPNIRETFELMYKIHQHLSRLLSTIKISVERTSLD